MEKYLQSVTDSLCGHPIAIASSYVQNLPEALNEAGHLREIWNDIKMIDVPDPDDEVLERCYLKVLESYESQEMDFDDLDCAVGAAKPQASPTKEI